MLLEALSKQSGVKIQKLLWIAETASRRYKVYTIPKRSGGERVIEHPSRELKAIQRWINHYLLRRFPVHASAQAYKKGASIRNNALIHRTSNYTVRLDFRDFFPSFSDAHIRNFLTKENEARELDLAAVDITFISKIVSRRGCLTIGAPTSPIITNAMMFGFDTDVLEICNEHELVFTRYADDLFVSGQTPTQLPVAVNEIGRIAANFEFADLRINHAKTAFLSKKYKRSITGLVVTPQHRVSLGRRRKREIKTLAYLYLNGELSVERNSYLRGLLAFASDAEPDFVDALRTKFGPEAIERLLKS